MVFWVWNENYIIVSYIVKDPCIYMKVVYKNLKCKKSLQRHERITIYKVLLLSTEKI